MSYIQQIVGDVRQRILREYMNYVPKETKREHHSLIRAVRERERAAVISEIKPASPSEGDLRFPLDPAALAIEMEEGGAAGISVLTEPKHFKGSVDNLIAVRRAVDLPVLMKDFFVDERQIYRAAEVGADAILLIPSICDLPEFHRLAAQLGLESLIEVHSEGDVDAAADVGAKLVGINNRDLKTLEVDIGRTVELVTPIRDRCGDVVVVSESGISSPRHVRYVLSRGADAVLVGTSIMRAGDVAGKVRSLVESV
ncbi:MAG: indole-3-glycerol-phosphate synthase [Candidatus Geothermarchaeales archaeon]